MVRYGQVVVGAAGAGKTTYCNGVRHLLSLQKRDSLLVVNLDPASDNYAYECDLDVRDLVCAREVAQRYELGPNGALVFCMEHLERNVSWLCEKLESIASEGSYVVFDCPGQVELFSSHASFKNVLRKLEKRLGFRFVCVHLVDVQLCTDHANFLSAILLSLGVMLNLELSHVNCLSKCDTIATHGDLALPLERYLDPSLMSTSQFRSRASRGLSPKFDRLTQGLAELNEDYSLVDFTPIAVEDGKSMHALLRTLDKCLGYTAKAAKDAKDVQAETGATEAQALVAALDASLGDGGLSVDWQEHFARFAAAREGNRKGEEDPQKTQINSK